MTNEAKHTPGPWTVESNGKYTNVSDLDGDTIAWVDRPVQLNQRLKEDTIKANARLIAAAPELLEALEALLDEYGIEYSGPQNRAEEIAVAAIKKAKGGQ